MNWALPALAGADIAGGLIEGNQQRKWAEGQTNLQKEFAQNGISWRVADAARVGISPLAAIGATSGPSFNPIQIGETGFGKMGQDLTRAYAATRTGEQRLSMDDLLQKKANLAKTQAETDYWASMAAKNRSQMGPELPISDTQQFRDSEGHVYSMPSFDYMQATHVNPVDRAIGGFKNALKAIPALISMFNNEARYKLGTYRQKNRLKTVPRR